MVVVCHQCVIMAEKIVQHQAILLALITISPDVFACGYTGHSTGANSSSKFKSMRIAMHAIATPGN